MAGHMKMEKPKNFKVSFIKLAKYMKRYLPAVVISVCLAVASTVLTLLGPDKIGEMSNVIQVGMFSGIDFNRLTSISVTLTIFYSLSLIFAYTQNFIMSTITQKTTKRLRTEISIKINKLPIWYYNKTSVGDVLSRVTNDVDTIGMTLNQVIGSLISSVILFFGSMVMMFKTHWLMAITAVLATTFGFAFMSIIIKRSQKYFMQQQKELGKLNGHIEEIYSGHIAVKTFNGEKQAIKEFSRINDKLANAAWKAQFMSGLMQPFMAFIGNFGYVAVCIVGALLVINGHISYGIIVSFMIYIRLFTQPLGQIAQSANSLQLTAAASERVFEFLSEQEMPDESHKVKRIEKATGDVEFRNVQFGYEDDDKIIINDFSAHAKPGQKIAIVGPTGAGKTTIVNLLMRFNEINQGEILLDGIPIKELTRENVHEQFCMVLQDTWLFEGTIRENLVYCKEDVNDQQLDTACKAVGIYHFIKTLPNGYDTHLKDHESLSAGQKQQLTIARAIIQNAPMLILDEATSSVDTRTEKIIQQAMDNLTKGRTSFVIAHRLSTIRNADLILVMKDGDIIESGSHDRLLEEGGFYAELYNSQFNTAS